MTYYTTEEAITATATLTRMAAKILIFLFLQEPGRSFTGVQLAAKYGTSTNTISAAMRNLDANGFVQNNGKNYGWSLVPRFSQMALPFVRSEAKLIQKFLDQPKDDPKIFGSSPPSYDDDDLILNSEREDHHHHHSDMEHDPKKIGSTPDHSGVQERKRLLRHYGVRGKAIMRYSTPPCPKTAVILALGWESLTQPLNNPGGWIHSQLRGGYVPGRDYLELAELWLELDDEDRDEFRRLFWHGSASAEIALRGEYELSQEAAQLAVELPTGAFD